MKLILSRRAFDAGAGWVAKPFSVPGENLGMMASDLTHGKKRPDRLAHRDPDLGTVSTCGKSQLIDH